MRADQIRHLLDVSLPAGGLSVAVAGQLGYEHFTWISKDVDAFFAHQSRSKITYEVPESTDTAILWPTQIAELIKTKLYYTDYNSALVDGQKGKFLLHDYQIFESEVSASGWKVTFSYSLIDPTTPFW